MSLKNSNPQRWNPWTLDNIREIEDTYKVKCRYCKFIAEYHTMSLSLMRYHLIKNHPDKTKQRFQNETD